MLSRGMGYKLRKLFLFGFKMKLHFVFFTFSISPGVLTSIVESICAPEACLDGATGSQLSVGAVVDDSLASSSTLLLPGTYPRFHDTSFAHASPGFEVSQQANLVVSQTSPLIAYPRPVYQDQPQLSTEDSSELSGPIASFLLAPGYQATFETDGALRVAVHDSCPNTKHWHDLKGLKLISIDSSNCPGGCGVGGSCNHSTSTCLCTEGYAGPRCDSCANGYFGPDCQPCPNCDQSLGTTCDDGTTGTGACVTLNSNNTQNLLSASQTKCNCLNGVCGDKSTCLCSTGWTTLSNETLCASCATGFFLDTHGECVACGPGCKSCASSTGICQSCVPGLQLANDSMSCVPSPMNSTGATSCNEGFYNSYNSTCAPCDPGCKACFGPSSSSCTKCPPTKALLSTGSSGNSTLSASCVDFDSKTGVCSSPPNTLFLFNQTKGVCDPAPRLCLAARIPESSVLHPELTTTLDAVCSSCVTDALLLPNQADTPEGRCVGVCPDGTYDDRRGHCAICPAGCSTCLMPPEGSHPRCTSCASLDLFLLGDTCVQACPAGTFATISTNTPQAFRDVNACLSCSASCGTCSQSPTACQSCPKTRPAFDLASQTCALTCQKGQFPDLNAGGRCSPCDASCATCAGPKATDCLSCKDGDALQKGKCRASSCATNTTQIVRDWGVCLEDLLASNDDGYQGLPAWLVVLINLFLSVLFGALCLLLWRFWQRRKRRAKSKQFRNELATSDIKLHQLDGGIKLHQLDKETQLHQLDGPATQEDYLPGWSDETIAVVLNPSSPAPRRPTPTEFKIKRKVVPAENRLDDWEGESMSAYSHSDYHSRLNRVESIPELPSSRIDVNPDDQTVQNAQTANIWLESETRRSPSLPHQL